MQHLGEGFAGGITRNLSIAPTSGITLGRRTSSAREALALAQQEPERRFLAMRICEL